MGRPPNVAKPKPRQTPTPNQAALAAVLESGVPLLTREDTAVLGAQRVDLTTAGRTVVRLLSAEGNDQATIAHRLGVGLSTFKEIIKRDDALAEAIAVGKAALSDELAHLLLRGAREGNIVAAIYLSKARCGWRENDAPEAAKPNIVIQLPGAMNEQQYMDSLRVIDQPPQLKGPSHD
jgi:hypothetical protein